MRGRRNRAQREAGWSEGLGKGPIASLSVGLSNAFKKDVVERRQGREGAGVSCLHPSMDHFLSVWKCLSQNTGVCSSDLQEALPGIGDLAPALLDHREGCGIPEPQPPYPQPPHTTLSVSLTQGFCEEGEL